MFEGDLTEDQHRQLEDMSSIDVPEKIAQKPWTRSEFRVLLAMTAFAAIGHHPDRNDVATLTRLAKTTTAEALERLCAEGDFPPWIEATDAYRVPARPKQNGARGGGRRRQRYVIRWWQAEQMPSFLLASGAIQVDLGIWARRILITLGSVMEHPIVITGTGVRVVEIAEAEARRRLFELAGVHPSRAELQEAFEDLQAKGLIGRCNERLLRKDRGTDATCVYRRVELHHPRLLWSRGAAGDRGSEPSPTALAQRT